MSHSIIRVQKMNSTAIKGIQFHNQREKESKTNPDIRKEDAHLNYDFINGNKKLDYKKEIQQVISENVKSEKKIRKDAVLLSEFLITSDSAFFDKLTPDEQKRYFETAKDFIAEKYGEQNIIYATVHNDEKTPHMHVGLVPVTEDGRLSAKDVFGRRMEFVKLQDNFNAHVNAQGFDLERGVSSNRKHLDVVKFKAKTAYEAEKEATEKYEHVMSKIKAIDEKTKTLEDVKATKKLGHVLMKNEDYDTLVNYAVNGAVAEVEATDLERKLAETKREIVTLKEEEKKAQEKLRKSYSKVESESKKTQDQLENLADEKANKKVEEIFKEQEIVKKYNGLVADFNAKAKDYNELESAHNSAKKEISELKFAQKSFLREEAILNSTISKKEEEVESLKKENGSLQEQIKEMRNEFAALKERVVDVLNRQFTKIKTLLKVYKIEPEYIKVLDEKQDKIVEDSLKEMEKPKEKTQIQEMEL